MDGHHFDGLVRTLVTGPSRRGLLAGVAGATLAALLSRAGWDTADAKRRKHKRKKKCQKKAKVCRDECGRVTFKCHKRKKMVDCTCATGQVCDAGACVACDVCASGCPFSTIQEAIADANAGDTLHLCPETYGETIRIAKDLTLLGAGDGEAGTILDGQDSGPVVTVTTGATVALQALRITGGNAGGGIGGGINNLGTLTLSDCTVRGNTANGGGGISNGGALMLAAATTVTENHAAVGGGGILNDGVFGSGTSTCTGDSSVSGNTAGDPPEANDCVELNGGNCGTC